MLKLK
ncbi:hypothetical protein VCHC41B1_3346A, partial [Vibrio cholerae HC-41B1]